MRIRPIKSEGIALLPYHPRKYGTHHIPRLEEEGVENDLSHEGLTIGKHEDKEGADHGGLSGTHDHLVDGALAFLGGRDEIFYKLNLSLSEERQNLEEK